MSLTYSKYLKIDELLRLQQPKSKDHDEVLFIVIHQVYELWFKQVLHETQFLVQNLNEGETYHCLSNLKRILTIFKTLVGQIDILETMTPLSFNSFRNLLESSSGFQSAQFRKLEFLLGHKRERMLEVFNDQPDLYSEIKVYYKGPTLYDALLKYLKIKGYDVPKKLFERDVQLPIEANENLQKTFVAIYKNDPLISQLLERLVDLDEGLQEWRYRHVKMVERTIGTKTGTGGSSGVEYLRATLFQPIFADLWAIRAQL